MVDVWLIIVTIVMGVVLLAASFYLYVVYCHPEDKGFGSKIYFKLIVITSFFLCGALVLSLPMDVANSRGEGGGLRVDVLVKIIFLLMFIFIIFLLPFSIFLYETDDEKGLVSSLNEVWKNCRSDQTTALYDHHPWSIVLLRFRRAEPFKNSNERRGRRLFAGFDVVVRGGCGRLRADSSLG